MNIEQVPINIWTDVISGKINPDYQFLALKILLARLKLKTMQDPSPVVMQESIDEIKKFFIKCIKIPSCRADFEKITNSK